MKYEDRVLKFIGQPENIETALEVASYVDKLKLKTHWRFWAKLNAKLERFFQASTFYDSWKLQKMSKKNLNKGYVGCHLVPIVAKDSPLLPCLHFAFRQYPLQNKQGLYYGIRWMDAAKTPEGISPPELKNLEMKLRDQDVRTNPPNWPAWFVLGHSPLSTDFLVKMSNESDDFVSRLAADFWDLFVVNVVAVEQINRVYAVNFASQRNQ